MIKQVFRGIEDFFDTPERRDIQAKIEKTREECRVIQESRRARVDDHDPTDCDAAYDNNCHICEQLALERHEDSIDMERSAR